ncbi:ATP-binding protein [Spirosoma foliorum]|nr:ATP-binding protein [Spirosoma foliorum]
MKSHYLLLLLIFSPIQTIAQSTSRAIDSLRRELSEAKTDTARMWLMTDLSIKYFERNFDSARYYAEQGIQLAHTLGHLRGELKSRVLLGQSYSTRDIPHSIRIYLQALQLAQQTNQIDDQGQCYYGIGILYGFLENSPLAINNFKQAHTIGLKVHDQELASFASAEVGGAYGRMHKVDSARYYLTLSEQEYPPIRLYPFQVLYWARVEKGTNPTQAAQLYRRSIQVFKAQNELRGLGYAYGAYGEFLQQHNQPDSSLLLAKASLQISLKLINYRAILTSSQLLTNLYQDLNRPDSAYKYQSIMIIARDSLFSQQKFNQIQTTLIEEQQRVQQLQDEKSLFESRVKIYGLLGMVAVLLLLAGVFYRNNRQKQKANEELQTLNQEVQQQKEEIESQRDYLEETLTELKSTQDQLIQKEKLASLGELTAGIAHEIQNPLNFVNNFSEVSTELIEELKEEVQAGNIDEVMAITDDLTSNLHKINHHGGRASSIVKGMLEHSRTESGERRPTDLNALADEYLKIAYHGLRAKDKSNFNCELVNNFDPSLDLVNVGPQEIGRVLLNLYNNAFYAVSEKQKTAPAEFKPTVTVSTRLLSHSSPEGASSLTQSSGLGTTGMGSVEERIEIRVRDNGTGIPESVKSKIFQPFFTTKPTGEGTGLGLSLSYDIITKGHGGSMAVESQPGQGTLFTIQLPIR